MSVLLSGGAGFIGSHTYLALQAAKTPVVMLDNFYNSSPKVLERLEKISGQPPVLYQGDIRDRKILQKIFAENEISTVIHFAGLKAVGESVREPMMYYDNNVVGSMILAEEMAKAGVFNIIFSSSATVYGDPAVVPITEASPTGATTNPYGTSKHMVERIYSDMQAADPRWSVVLLRYFNPVGAHESGLIGEHPNGIPNNLLPYVCQVASGKLKELSVFGSDYPTPDGSGVRDYIHVMDLAEGHVAALQKHENNAGLHIYNLGTGKGYSVLDIVNAFAEVNGVEIPYKVAPRRAGDIAACFADPTKASQQLGWQAKRDLKAMMGDAWRWQSNNPNGYE